MSEDLVAEDHLLRMVALCQLPKEDWSPEDRKMLVEARKFIKRKQEEKDLEGRCEEGNRGVVEPGRKRKDSSKADREVRKDVNAIEEGSKDPTKARDGP